jgi:hypothetical protein
MPAWWACIARSVGMYRLLDGHVLPARWALADKLVISRVSKPIIAFYAKDFEVTTCKLYPGFRTKPRI